MLGSYTDFSRRYLGVQDDESHDASKKVAAAVTADPKPVCDVQQASVKNIGPQLTLKQTHFCTDFLDKLRENDSFEGWGNLFLIIFNYQEKKKSSCSLIYDAPHPNGKLKRGLLETILCDKNLADFLLQMC